MPLNALAIRAALGEDMSGGQSPGHVSGGGVSSSRRGPSGGSPASRGSEEARGVDGCATSTSTAGPGTFGPLRRGADRAGAVPAVGGSRAEASSGAWQAAEAIRFEVSPAPGTCADALTRSLTRNATR